MNEKESKNSELILIPKLEQYIEYVLNMLMKLPRVEKFSIGTEYKSSMYEMMQNVLYLNKIENSKRLYYLNKIDALLNCQRIYLRIMKNNHWIDEKKFEVAIVKLAEIGRIIGGLIKYYAKNNKK